MNWLRKLVKIILITNLILTLFAAILFLNMVALVGFLGLCSAGIVLRVAVFEDFEKTPEIFRTVLSLAGGIITMLSISFLLQLLSVFKFEIAELNGDQFMGIRILEFFAVIVLSILIHEVSKKTNPKASKKQIPPFSPPLSC